MAIAKIGAQRLSFDYQYTAEKTCDLDGDEVLLVPITERLISSWAYSLIDWLVMAIGRCSVFRFNFEEDLDTEMKR